MTSFSGFLRRILGEGYLFQAVGFIGLPAAYYCSQATTYFLSAYQGDDWKKSLLRLVDGLVHDSSNLFIGSILVGLAISYLYGRGQEIWANVKKPVMKRVDDFKSEVLSAMRKHELDEVVAKLTENEALSLLPNVAAKAYGPHVTRMDSFYAQTSAWLGEFFDPRRPYRSGFMRDITIRELPNGKLCWHETTAYDVCCDLLENCHKTQVSEKAKECFDFPLRYYSQTRVAEADVISAIRDARIEMTVDDDCVFDAQRDIWVGDDDFGSSSEHVSVEYADGCLAIDFSMSVPVSRSGIKVRIEETSTLESTDNVGVFRSKVPTKRARFHISLPDGWGFKEFIFGNKSLWEARCNPENVLIANADSWITPGLLMSCIYEKGIVGKPIMLLPDPIAPRASAVELE